MQTTSPQALLVQVVVQQGVPASLERDSKLRRTPNTTPYPPNTQNDNQGPQDFFRIPCDLTHQHDATTATDIFGAKSTKTLAKPYNLGIETCHQRF
eukprot:2923061-Amphidinium_carterae.2